MGLSAVWAFFAGLKQYLAIGAVVLIGLLAAVIWWQAGRIDGLKLEQQRTDEALAATQQAFEEYKGNAEYDIEQLTKLQQREQRRNQQARNREKEIRDAHPNSTEPCAPALCDAIERLRRSEQPEAVQP